MTLKTVIAPRGIPGSGKSTWVLDQIENIGPGKAVRINNDSLSESLFGAPFIAGNPTIPDLLHYTRMSLLQTYLTCAHVEVIFLDNTNLVEKHLRQLEKVAHEYGADFVVYDEFLSVSTQECIERDAARERSVGEAVIKRMASQAAGLKPWRTTVTPPVILPYHNDPELPPVVLCDVDGTVALLGDRSPYDATRVHLDSPNDHVIPTLDSLSKNYRVIFLSGRSEEARAATEEWLREHVAGDYEVELYMRAARDFRPDWIVKHELFQRHIADKFRVVAVLDDRDQVIRMWRDRLVLPTFQVNWGDF